MLKNIIYVFVLLCCINTTSTAQKSYSDSLQAYRFKYVNTHEVVKTLDDRKLLTFFDADSNYRVVATFTKIDDKIGFKMPTSAKSIQQYYRYGKISFTINGTALELFVYQPKDVVSFDEEEDLLFIPFFDLTNGSDTYEGGRYIDISSKDIVNNTVVIDFNKAYNPYCCYTSGYHCPIPPKENSLNFAMKAGEKKYPHHIGGKVQ